MKKLKGGIGKRALSVLLSFVMLVTSMPAEAFAATQDAATGLNEPKYEFNVTEIDKQEADKILKEGEIEEKRVEEISKLGLTDIEKGEQKERYILALLDKAAMQDKDGDGKKEFDVKATDLMKYAGLFALDLKYEYLYKPSNLMYKISGLDKISLYENNDKNENKFFDEADFELHKEQDYYYIILHAIYGKQEGEQKGVSILDWFKHNNLDMTSVLNAAKDWLDAQKAAQQASEDEENKQDSEPVQTQPSGEDATVPGDTPSASDAEKQEEPENTKQEEEKGPEKTGELAAREEPEGFESAPTTVIKETAEKDEEKTESEISVRITGYGAKMDIFKNDVEEVSKLYVTMEENGMYIQPVLHDELPEYFGDEFKTKLTGDDILKVVTWVTKECQPVIRFTYADGEVEEIRPDAATFEKLEMSFSAADDITMVEIDTEYEIDSTIEVEPKMAPKNILKAPILRAAATREWGYMKDTGGEASGRKPGGTVADIKYGGVMHSVNNQATEQELSQMTASEKISDAVYISPYNNSGHRGTVSGIVANVVTLLERRDGDGNSLGYYQKFVTNWGSGSNPALWGYCLEQRKANPPNGADPDMATFDDYVVGDTFVLGDVRVNVHILEYVLYHGFNGQDNWSYGGLSGADNGEYVTMYAVWAVMFGTLNYSAYNNNVTLASDRAAISQLYNDAVAYAAQYPHGREPENLIRTSMALLDSGSGYQVLITARTLAPEDNPPTTTGTNEGSAKIKKTSSNTGVTNGDSHYSLEGIKYTVYEDSACTTIAKDTSDNNAVLTIDASGNSNTLTFDIGEDEEKTYYLKETYVPDSSGYKQNDTITSFVVKSEQTTTVSVTDEPYPSGKLTWRKVDGVFNGVITGAEFTVERWNGSAYEPYETLTTTNGTYVTSRLYADKNNPDGLFRIVESAVPAGYTGNYEREIKLSEKTPTGGTYSLGNVYNTPEEYDVWITKTDDLTGEILGTAEFGVYEYSKSLGRYKDTYTLMTFDPVEQKYYIQLTATLENQGRFKVKELTPPSNRYRPEIEEEIRFTKDGNHTFDISATNSYLSKKGGVTVTKVDADTGDPIPGVVFEVYKWNAKSGTSGDWDNQVFDVLEYKDGVYRNTFDYYRYERNEDPYTNNGLFKVVERSSAPGYINDKWEETFEIIDDGDYDAKHIIDLGEVPNRQNSYEIIKVTADGETPLAGVVFRITNDDTGEYQDKTTGADGIIKLSKIPQGSYTYYEQSVPDGYQLDDTVRHFIVDEDGYVNGEEHVETEITNYPERRIILEKFDFDTNSVEIEGETALKSVSRTFPEGTEFTFYEWSEAEQDYKANPYLNAIWMTDRFAEATTFSTPVLRYTEDNIGKFKVVETNFPEGYLVQSLEQEIVIPATNPVPEETIDVINKANRIVINKKDNNGNPMVGVSFKMWKVGDEANAVAIATGDGGVAEVERIPEGIWYLEETATLAGFAKDTKKYVFTVGADGKISYGGNPPGDSVTVEFINYPYVVLKLIKKDSVTNARSHYESGFPQGTKFYVYEWDSEIGDYKSEPTTTIIYQGDFTTSAIPDNAFPNAGEEKESDEYAYKVLVRTNSESIFTSSDNVLYSHENFYIVGYKTLEERDNALRRLNEYPDVEATRDILFMTSDGTAGQSESQDDRDASFEYLEKAISTNTVTTADIALIDTGASYDNVVKSVSMIGEDASDDNGHGTLMAKYIGEQNPNAKVISIKAIGADGTGSMSSIIAAFEYALTQNVKIISLSVSAYAPLGNKLLEDEIRKATDKNILVVGAAGNNDANVANFVPGNIEEAMIVGACQEDGSGTETSNFGDTVDFCVVADTTSEATARASGWISTLDGNVWTHIKTDGFCYSQRKTSTSLSDAQAYSDVPTIQATTTMTYNGRSISAGAHLHIAPVDQYWADSYNGANAEVVEAPFPEVNGYGGSVVFRDYESGRAYPVHVYYSNTSGTWSGNEYFKESAFMDFWKYSVSYNANGGSGAPSASTGYYGQSITLSSTKPTRSSSTKYTTYFNGNGGTAGSSSLSYTDTTTYPFNGWNTASNGSGTNYAAGATWAGRGTSFSSINTSYDYNGASSTLYAKWGSASTSYGSITLPSASRTGYTFAGWYTAASGGSRVTSTRPGNTTLYAHWTANTYDVRYSANGGSFNGSDSRPGTAVSGQTYVMLTYDSSVIKLNTPSRTGYTFTGWKITGANTGTGVVRTSTNGAWSAVANKTYNNSHLELKNLKPSSAGATVEITAQWQINSYYISAVPNNANYGSASGTGTYNYGAAYTLTATPKAGYKFSKWEWSGAWGGGTNTTNPYRGTMGTSGGTATAVFVPYVLTLRYDTNGGNVNKAGYNKSGTLVRRTSDNTTDFDKRNYGSTATDLFDYTTFGLERTGYHIDGASAWNTRANGTGTSYNQATAYAPTTFASNLTTADRTVTLYANWKPNTYSIAFNRNTPAGETAGGANMSNLAITYDTSKNLTPCSYTVAGYAFQGWATSAARANAGTVDYSNAQSVKNLTATNGGTVTLYAVWKQDGKYLDTSVIDADLGSYVPGATYALFGSNGNEIERWTTGNSFKRSTRLNPGTYTIKEISRAPGYEPNMNDTVITITTSSQFRTPVSITLHQEKQTDFVDEATGTYAVFPQSATNEGKWKLVEVESTPGYIMDSTTLEFTINDRNSTTFVYEMGDTAPRLLRNTPNEYKVRKIDTNGNPLAGATFALRAVGSNTNIATAVSGTDGYAKFMRIAPGQYRVYEIASPAGYQAVSSSDYVEMEVDENGNVIGGDTMTFVNFKITTNYEIAKTVDGAAMAGINFTATNGTNELTFTTDANGVIKLTTTNLVPEGTWTFVESENNPVLASLGVTRDTTTFLIRNDGTNVREVNASGTEISANKRISNKRNSLVLMKKDSLNNQAIGFVDFAFWKDVSPTEMPATPDYLETTAADGSIKLKGLSYGTWYYKEVSRKDGYLLDSTIRNFVVDDTTTVVNLTAVNVPSHVEINKKDDADNPVDGATIRIWSDVNADLFWTLTTSGGKVSLDRVPDGTYNYKEMSAPAGYIVDKNTYQFTVTDGVVSPSEMTITNVTNHLVLEKVDVNGNPLSDVGYTVYYKKLATDAETSSTTTTDASGKIEMSAIADGYYRIVETTPKPGFHNDNKPISFVVADGRITDKTPVAYTSITRDFGDPMNVSYQATNKKYSEISLKVIKKDKETQLPLSGAEFKLYGFNGTGYAEIGTLTDKNDGTYEYTLIPVSEYMSGEFKVVETKAPSGYSGTYSKQFKVDVFDTVDEIVYTAENVSNEIVIRKIDAETKQVINEQAKFRVNSTEYTTTAGEIKLQRLAPGNYEVQEVTPPRGYKRNVTTFSFTVGEDGRITRHTAMDGENASTFVDVTGTRLTLLVADEKKDQEIGRIQIVKQNEDGERLVGAIFAVYEWIYDPANPTEPGAYSTTPMLTLSEYEDEHGDHYYANDVPFKRTEFNLGKFKVVETRAPQGYQANFTKEFVVQPDIEELQIFDYTAVNVENKFTVKKKGITVNESGELVTNDLNNVKFRFETLSTDQDDVNRYNKEYTTSGNGEFSIEGLVPGTYQLTEIEAPTGYIIADPTVTVFVDVNNKIYIDGDSEHAAFEYTFTKSNEQNYVEIEKKDEHNAAVANAEFTFKWTSPDGNETSTFTAITNAEGKIFKGQLADGMYEVWESAAPSGHQLNKKRQTFKVENSKFSEHDNAIDNNARLRLEFTDFTKLPDPIKASIFINKTTNKGRNVENAEFTVYPFDMNMNNFDYAAGINIPYNPTTQQYELISEIWGDNKNNSRWLIEETKLPDGLAKPWSQEILIETDGQEFVFGPDDASNAPINLETSFKIHKYDLQTGANMAGAIFEYWFGTGDTIHQLAPTDENGIAVFPNLPAGVAVSWRENEAPRGYVKDDTIHNFWVDDDGYITLEATPEAQKYTEYVYEMPNEPKKTIKITKEIDATRIMWQHGNPTFVFRLTGEETGVEKYISMEFTPEYVSTNQENGRVSMTYKFDKLFGDNYRLEEMDVLRYEVSEIRDIIGGIANVEGGYIDFDMFEYIDAEVTFENSFTNIGQDTHNAMVLNSIGPDTPVSEEWPAITLMDVDTNAFFVPKKHYAPDSYVTIQFYALTFDENNFQIVKESDSSVIAPELLRLHVVKGALETVSTDEYGDIKGYKYTITFTMPDCDIVFKGHNYTAPGYVN